MMSTGFETTTKTAPGARPAMLGTTCSKTAAYFDAFVDVMIRGLCQGYQLRSSDWNIRSPESFRGEITQINADYGLRFGAPRIEQSTS